MSFKRYRIIFILIFFILCWDGTYVDASEAETTKQQQHVTNDLENAQSGELFTFCLLFLTLHALVMHVSYSMEDAKSHNKRLAIFVTTQIAVLQSFCASSSLSSLWNAWREIVYVVWNAIFTRRSMTFCSLIQLLSLVLSLF